MAKAAVLACRGQVWVWVCQVPVLPGSGGNACFDNCLGQRLHLVAVDVCSVQRTVQLTSFV